MLGETLKEGEQKQKESTKKYNEMSDKNAGKLDDWIAGQRTDTYENVGNLNTVAKGGTTETGENNSVNKDTLAKTVDWAKKNGINISNDPSLSAEAVTKQFQIDLYTKLYSTPQGQAKLRAIRDKYGNTNEGKKNKISTEDLMKSRDVGLAAFVDGKGGARMGEAMTALEETTSSMTSKIDKTEQKKTASEKLAEDFKLGDGEPIFIGDKAIGTMYFTRPKGDRGYSNYQYVALDFGHMTKGGTQNMTEDRYKNTTKGSGLEDAFNNVILIPADIVNTQFNGGRTQTAEWYKALYDMATNQKLSGQRARNFDFMDQGTRNVVSEKIKDARVLSKDGTIGLDVASVAVK